MATTQYFQGILSFDTHPFNHLEPRSSGTSEPFSSTPHGSQTGAGLDVPGQGRCAIGAMECANRARFGFRFTICAGRHDQASISAEFERRLAGEPAVEYRTAWTEIAAITASRLAVRLQAPDMP